LAGFILLMGVNKTWNKVGKSENQCLRYCLEPFLVLFKVFQLAVYFYFIFWQQFCKILVVKWWNANTMNWWKSKNDPWITNASYFNAVLCWFTYLLTFPILVLLVMTTGVNMIRFLK